MFKRVKWMRLAALAKRARAKRLRLEEAAMQAFGVKVLYLADNDNRRM
jgi:hypothetical protein